MSLEPSEARYAGMMRLCVLVEEGCDDYLVAVATYLHLYGTVERKKRCP